MNDANTPDDESVDDLLEATTALLPALLNAMEALGAAGRHLHPPNLMALAQQMNQFKQPVDEGLRTFGGVQWPAHLQSYAEAVTQTAESVSTAITALAESVEQENPMMAAYRAVGHNTKAVESLYPVASMLPPVSRFYLEADRRDDAPLLDKLAAADNSREEVGVMHANNAVDERGGFSLYVPEYYDAGEPTEGLPLVVALHGGSGHGRRFLWTWLTQARTRGAIVLSPSSRDGTWSLMGPDIDSANVDGMVAYVCEHWHVDTSRILLTGMSDGGTFSYVSGLREDAVYTHLAPVSASFHPMLIQSSAPGRLQGLPVYLVHGALDWMFPVDMARMAQQTLTAAGARVEYVEIDDLSHTYPREQNALILDWLKNPVPP